eukprot:symbB.v1.2.002049.t1/scaffold108.1/size328462/4
MKDDPSTETMEMPPHEGNVSSADTSMNISSTNQGLPAGAPVPAVPVAPVAPAAPAPPPPQTEANALAAAFASVGTAAGGVSTPNQARLAEGSDLERFDMLYAHDSVTYPSCPICK